MISEKMIPLMKNNSAIRMMFEEGNKLAAKYGRENAVRMCLISALEIRAYRLRQR